MIPKFENGVVGQSSAEDSEKPLNEEDLGLDVMLHQLLMQRRLVVGKQRFEGSAGDRNVVVFEGEDFPEEGVSEDDVAED